jgi:hypothetical protein
MILMLLGVFAWPLSCGGSGDDDDSGADVADVRDVPPEDTGPTRTETNPTDGVLADFVIDSLRIGSLTAGEGFNLDGVYTRAGDPLFPEDGPGGVDNQLGDLIFALEEADLEVNADESIAEGIADGSLLILLRHVDVDDWDEDPGYVYLYGYAGKDTDDDPLNNLTGAGELLVDERSLQLPPTDLARSLIHFDNGVLEVDPSNLAVLQEGDFSAGPSLFRVDIPMEDSTLTLEVNGTRIVWDLDDAPTGNPGVDGRIINGLLGGYVYVRDAARALSQIDLSGASIDVATLRSLLAGQADMDVVPPGFQDDTCTVSTTITDCAPGQTCQEDDDRGGAYYCYEHPDNLDAISLGLTFTAVSCRITGIWDDPEWP